MVSFPVWLKWSLKLSCWIYRLRFYSLPLPRSSILDHSRADNGSYSIPELYDSSRERFRSYEQDLQILGWRPQCTAFPLPDYPELTTDVICCPAVEKPENLLVYTLGKHGIEAYFGAVVLNLLVHEYIPKIQSKYIRIINPRPESMGMKHHRRVNLITSNSIAISFWNQLNLTGYEFPAPILSRSMNP